MAAKRKKIKKSTVIYLTVMISVLLFGYLSYGAFLIYRAAAADVAVPRIVSQTFFYLSQELTHFASWLPFAAMAFAVSRSMKYTAWKSVALFTGTYIVFCFSMTAIEYSSDGFLGYMFSNLGRYTLAVMKSGYAFTLLANLTFALSAVLAALLVRHIVDGRKSASGFRRDALIVGAGIFAPMLISIIEYTVRFISASAFSPADFGALALDILLVILMNGIIPFAMGLLLIKIFSSRFQKTAPTRR